jgi:succinate dehydrogenase/fumarate reductase flavoprotein subunit
LFAAGDGRRRNGANRLSGNAITEALVSGDAGRSAAAQRWTRTLPDRAENTAAILDL